LLEVFVLSRLLQNVHFNTLAAYLVVDSGMITWLQC